MILHGLRIKAACMAAIIVCAATLPNLALAATSDTPKDVPVGHVAADSVKLLISKGYLPLYDDGTFKGNNTVDRYTLAIVIARLIKDMDSGKVQMSDDDTRLVQKLSTEFREELVSQGVEVDKLRTDLGSAKSDATAKDAANAKVEATQTQAIADLNRQLAQYSPALSALGSRLSVLEGKLQQQAVGQDAIDSMQAKVDSLERDMAATKAKSASDLSYMKTLAFVGTLGGVLASILIGSAQANH